MHSIIGGTVHSMPLNSLEDCTCTTTMTNIRPDWNSNLVLPGYRHQSIRISHRGRQAEWLESRGSQIRPPLWNSGFKETNVYSHSLVKTERPRGSVLGSDRQGWNFAYYVLRAVLSHSSHHAQEVLLAHFRLYV